MKKFWNGALLVLGLGSGAFFGNTVIGPWLGKIAFIDIPKLVQSQTDSENQKVLQNIRVEHKEYVAFLKSVQKELYDLSVLVRIDSREASQIAFTMSDEFGETAESLDKMFSIIVNSEVQTPDDIRELLIKYLQVRKHMQINVSIMMTELPSELRASLGPKLPNRIELIENSLKELTKNHP